MPLLTALELLLATAGNHGNLIYIQYSGLNKVSTRNHKLIYQRPIWEFQETQLGSSDTVQYQISNPSSDHDASTQFGQAACTMGRVVF